MSCSSKLLAAFVLIPCIAGHTAPRTSAHESELGQSTSATMENGDRFEIWQTIQVQTSVDGKVTAISVESEYLTILHGRFGSRFERYERTTVLPTQNWQRALDEHLGKVRRRLRADALAHVQHLEGQIR